MQTARIAHLYDDPGPFASVLVDVSRDHEDAAHEVELRAREVREQLSEQGAPDQVAVAVADRLVTNPHQPAPLSRLVVATERGVLLDETMHERTSRPQAVWAPLPDLHRWIAAQDGSLPFVLAVVDHEGGDVGLFRSELANADEQAAAGGGTEAAHEEDASGRSHQRYQNVTETIWHRNAEAVVDQVLSHVRAGVETVLIAGEPRSRSDVETMLESTPADVVQLETGSRAADGGGEALWGAVHDALVATVAGRRLQVAHELRDRLGTGRSVATGVADVADAFVRGQVETLVFDPDATAEQTLSPTEHPGLALGAVDVAEPVRADLALVAAAALTGADATVAGTEALGGASTAALLRWDQSG